MSTIFNRRQSLALGTATLAGAIGVTHAETSPQQSQPSPNWGGGQKRTVRSSDGTNLHVREWGVPTGKPILLLHGWTQASMSWAFQYGGSLAGEFRLVAFDLRGHGSSDKPTRESAYTDGKLWADDVAAVVAALNLTRPVIVGSSYAGFVICDYLARYGVDSVRAINFVGAAVLNTEPTHFGQAFGELLPGMTDENPAVNVEATRRFVRAYHHLPLDADNSETILGFSMLTPPEVRKWCVSRELNFTGVLKSIKCPTLATQGSDDAFVALPMHEHILRSVPRAVGSRYDQVSHAPYFESPTRFNQELAALARGA